MFTITCTCGDVAFSKKLTKQVVAACSSSHDRFDGRDSLPASAGTANTFDSVFQPFRTGIVQKSRPVVKEARNMGRQTTVIRDCYSRID